MPSFVQKWTGHSSTGSNDDSHHTKQPLNSALLWCSLASTLLDEICHTRYKQWLVTTLLNGLMDFLHHRLHHNGQINTCDTENTIKTQSLHLSLLNIAIYTHLQLQTNNNCVEWCLLSTDSIWLCWLLNSDQHHLNSEQHCLWLISWHLPLITTYMLTYLLV